MRFRHSTIAFVVLLCAATLPGCSRRTLLLTGTDNQPPTIQLARPGQDVRHIDWSAHDPDGRIDHYEITSDPNAIATGAGIWERTEARAYVLQGRPAAPGAMSGRRATATRFFGVRAVDDQGATSVVVARAFEGDNVTPEVQIVAPRPSSTTEALLVNGSTIRWEGTDPDARTGKPLEYRYLLIDDPQQITLVLSNPDTLRALYGPDYGEWTSVGRRTELTLEGLAELRQYMLVVIAIDEQGDATALFSRATNMLKFNLVHPGTHGPILSVFGAVTYRMNTGGVHDDPATAPKFDVPAGQPLTINWFAAPLQFNDIAGYRWALDPKDPGEPGDDKTRGDWSKWSLTTTSATIGPLDAGTEHRLYIEARDSGGLVTRLLIILNAVGLSFDRDVLIVDDMRLLGDQVVGGVYQTPVGAWPTAAELDTFLYARGGHPWQGAYSYPSNGGPYTSTPGIFNGYSFDTLGTRTTLQTNPVTLQILGRYRHVIWMVDRQTAAATSVPWHPASGGSWLAYDPAPLSSYIQAGGKVWLIGECGFAVMKSQNRPGTSPDVFSAQDLELRPGTFVYDFPHWRSEMTANRFTDQMNRTSARYSLFPEHVAVRQVGSSEDAPPPLRHADAFWYIPQTYTEYISKPNTILENGLSVLDTVYSSPISSSNPGPFPTMTVYRGSECGQVIMTGVPIWVWSRSSCIGLVDGVLQGIWGLQRDGNAPRVASAEVRNEPSGRRRR